jgi:hypothetical protein
MTVADQSRQLQLSFEPGLTARHRTLEDCCTAVVHNARQGVEGVAAHLDIAPSELSRRLNAHARGHEHEANNRPLRVSDMLGIIEATGDYRPIYWLIEKFIRDPESTRTAAIQQLAHLMPIVQALIEQSTEGGKVRAVK